MNEEQNSPTHRKSSKEFAVNELDAAYREMSKDEKRELEALEWLEAMISDASCDMILSE